MPNTKKTSIQLLIQTMGYEKARRMLEQLGLDVQNTGKNINRFGAVGKGVAMGLGWSFNKLSQNAGVAFAVMRSAILRTCAYSIINGFINALRSVNRAMLEGATISLQLGRAASILTQNERSARQTEVAYSKLVATITDTRNASYLLTKDLARVNFVLAIAGVRGKAFNQTLSIIDKMAAVTGESADSLTMDFVRLTNAFQIGEQQFQKAADVLVAGISNAVMLMPDLLNSVKMLGPTWVMAFGGGIDQLKQFTAAVGALSQVGLKGGQGARYLNRFLLGLLAPTQEAASLMYGLGVNVYKAVGESAPIAEALQKVQKEIGDLQIKTEGLTKARAQAIVMGQATINIDERIAKMQDIIKDKTSVVTDLYDDFVSAGGSLRELPDILNEFAGALERNSDKSLKMFQVFKKLFQLRGLRATSLIANMREWASMQQAMSKSEDTLDRIASTLDVSWGMALRKLQVTASQFVTLLTETLGGPILKRLADSLKADILDPILGAFQDEGRWQQIREYWKDQVEQLTFTSTGELLRLKILGPEALGLSASEYATQTKTAVEGMKQEFEPLKDFLTKLFSQTSEVAARVFVDTFSEVFKERFNQWQDNSTTGSIFKRVSKGWKFLSEDINPFYRLKEAKYKNMEGLYKGMGYGTDRTNEGLSIRRGAEVKEGPFSGIDTGIVGRASLKGLVFETSEGTMNLEALEQRLLLAKQHGLDTQLRILKIIADKDEQQTNILVNSVTSLERVLRRNQEWAKKNLRNSSTLIVNGEEYNFAD